MFSVTEVRSRSAIVVPVYFQPSVPRETVASILQSVFLDSDVFIAKDHTLIVVDHSTTALRLLEDAGPDSSYHGCRIHVLERNRGKAGAIEAGLRVLLDVTDAEFLLTRDCDGDHALEDIPRMVNLAHLISEWTSVESVTVMGGRPSLEKPMGWLREEWERFTNRVLVDLLAFRLASENRIIDTRFWASDIPDIQSGYRTYSRGAAAEAVRSLEQVPERKEIQTFACEFLPFADLTVNGGIFGQVQRQTLVEQPVSSYREVDFASVYGHLLSHAGTRMGVDAGQVLKIFDNHLHHCSLYFSDSRGELFRCRRMITSEGEPPLMLPFL